MARLQEVKYRFKGKEYSRYLLSLDKEIVKQGNFQNKDQFTTEVQGNTIVLTKLENGSC